MERYNDDELIYLMRCGSEEAKRCLYSYYYKQVRKWLYQFGGYNVHGYDKEDYIQFAMMIFDRVIDSYRDDQKASFKTYMKKVIMRRMLSYLRGGKNAKLYGKSVISLDDYASLNQDVKYEELIEDPRQRHQPDTSMYIKEKESYYLASLKQTTTFLERSAVTLKNEGYSHEEIAKTLDVSVKSVYNAIYRYHKKAQAIDELK